LMLNSDLNYIHRKIFLFPFLSLTLEWQDKRERNIFSPTRWVIPLITHRATGTTLVWKNVDILEWEKDKAINEVAIAKEINSPYVGSILHYFVDDESL
jgi:hypothetical protein